MAKKKLFLLISQNHNEYKVQNLRAVSFHSPVFCFYRYIMAGMGTVSHLSVATGRGRLRTAAQIEP